MNIESMKNYVEKLITNTEVVPALVGIKGIGKTEAIKQLAERMGIGYQAIYPSSLQGEDFMGLLIKDLESRTTQYLAPDFFPTQNAIDKGLFPERGILVLEEFNRSDTQTISALFPLLQERRINNHRLADGWHLMVSMNPETLEYTTNTIDTAGMDRILPINIEPDIDEYASYMIKSGQGNDSVLNFLYLNREMLSMDKITDDGSKTPSPRGWTKASIVINTCDLNDEEMSTTLLGLVGPEAAASYIGFLRDKDIHYPDAQEILNNYSDRQIVIVRDIMAKYRYDILTLTLRRLAIEVEPDNEEHMKNLSMFVKDLDSETKIVFVRILLAERKAEFSKILSKMPEFQQEVSSKLMSLI